MKRLIYIVCVLALVTSCKKDNSFEFYPYTNNELNDTTWYNTVAPQARVRQLDSVFAVFPKADSVDCINGGTVTLGDSISITFPPSFCSGSNAPASGKVKIEAIQLKQKGDMVRMAKPTMSYGSLLVTGGSVFIRVTYNGQELQLAPGKLITVRLFNKFSNTSLSGDMRVFYGKEDAFPATAAQRFTWVPWVDSPANRVVPVTAQQGTTGMTGYQFFSNRFGWVNCDYFSDSSQPRTKASVILPLNFTNANTHVFAVVKSPDVVAQLYGNPQTKTFGINNIYTGKVVTFVSLSFIAGKLYLGMKEVTTTSNMTVHLTPVQMPVQNIMTLLNGL